MRLLSTPSISVPFFDIKAAQDWKVSGIPMLANRPIF